MDFKELEVERLHDELETETINASVLRHTLTFFPRQIRTEIHDAVKAARESNTSVINELKVKLESLTKTIEKLTERDNELSKNISVLQ